MTVRPLRRELQDVDDDDHNCDRATTTVTTVMQGEHEHGGYDNHALTATVTTEGDGASLATMMAPLLTLSTCLTLAAFLRLSPAQPYTLCIAQVCLENDNLCGKKTRHGQLSAHSNAAYVWKMVARGTLKAVSSSNFRTIFVAALKNRRILSVQESQREMIELAPNVLYAFSTILGKGVGLIFSPAKVISAGAGVFLLNVFDADVCQAAKDAESSQEALADVFERIENFFKCLESYTEVPQTEAMTDIIVKIMVEVLDIFAIATKEIKQSGQKIPHEAGGTEGH
ncbi:hypothetical protein EDB87DRAFT_1581799 [Lactarius vividus]|nr:hypothetical protein EDB87DRAFT_1581799 [Lactarius vividus]